MSAAALAALAVSRIHAALAARWALWKTNDDALVQDACTAAFLAFAILASSPSFGG